MHRRVDPEEEAVPRECKSKRVAARSRDAEQWSTSGSDSKGDKIIRHGPSQVARRGLIESINSASCAMVGAVKSRASGRIQPRASLHLVHEADRHERVAAEVEEIIGGGPMRRTPSTSRQISASCDWTGP